ncbi:YybH family protein [Sphingomonas colocasiae]|uniref:DUF4440 domain-containing protein n=1 Tax=Sphingomonas colocasiae TaxID=1848973 RepID=A0ABS7PZJ5_9SPHN|nr:DUF4440 domain-containing protein [Sphingomonas colocasiae]
MLNRTMRQSLSFLVLAASLLAGCDGGGAGAQDRVAAEVKAAIHSQIDAYAARDAEKAASIVAPDIVAMVHGAPNIVGKPASAAAMKAQMADPRLKLAVSDESVEVSGSGDLAVYHATYRFTFSDPATKRPVTETGNWVAVFKRQADGTMKLQKDIVVDAPMPGRVGR